MANFVILKMDGFVQTEGRFYIDVDTIRVIVEDGKIVGWYNPNKEDTL